MAKIGLARDRLEKLVIILEKLVGFWDLKARFLMHLSVTITLEEEYKMYGI